MLAHTGTGNSLPLRLISGPKKSSGRVQVLHSGSWGGVCGKNFGKTDAKVVCKQLGFSGVKQVSHLITDKEILVPIRKLARVIEILGFEMF